MNALLKSLDTDWRHGLDVLKPSAAELEKGLALHRELGVCENYGFLPRIDTPEVHAAAAALAERGLGYGEWRRLIATRRIASATRDAEGKEKFFEIVGRAGIAGMIQSVNYIGETLEDAVPMLSAYRQLFNTFKDRLLHATCAEDLDEAKASGRLAVLFSLTGFPTAGAGSLANPEALLDWVEVWYHLGVRFMHLGYNRRNWFAEGCTEPHDGGVSDLGRELILRMNRVGLVVDVPHSSAQTTLHAAKISERPILATHIGCAAVHPHPRGKSDEEIKAIAATGGYVGICAVPAFLGPRADLSTLLRHVEHAVRAVGPSHVAIGTDRGHAMLPPPSIQYPAPLKRTIDPLGWNEANRPGSGEPPDARGLGSLAWSNWPLITVGLVKMGLKEEAIAAILGGNLRRVLRACRPAEETAAVAG